MIGDPHPGNPSEQREELATVANTQRKCVRPTIEIVKYLLQLFIEPDCCSPPFSAFRNIGVRKSSDSNESSEPVERHSPTDQIVHRDVPGAETCLIEGRGHLAIAVAPLFPENGDRRFVLAFENTCGRRLGFKRRSDSLALYGQRYSFALRRHIGNSSEGARFDRTFLPTNCGAHTRPIQEPFSNDRSQEFSYPLSFPRSMLKED